MPVRASRLDGERPSFSRRYGAAVLGDVFAAPLSNEALAVVAVGRRALAFLVAAQKAGRRLFSNGSVLTRSPLHGLPAGALQSGSGERACGRCCPPAPAIGQQVQSVAGSPLKRSGVSRKRRSRYAKPRAQHLRRRGTLCWSSVAGVKSCQR